MCFSLLPPCKTLRQLFRSGRILGSWPLCNMRMQSGPKWCARKNSWRSSDQQMLWSSHANEKDVPEEPSPWDSLTCPEECLFVHSSWVHEAHGTLQTQWKAVAWRKASLWWQQHWELVLWWVWIAVLQLSLMNGVVWQVSGPNLLKCKQWKEFSFWQWMDSVITNFNAAGLCAHVRVTGSVLWWDRCKDHSGMAVLPMRAILGPNQNGLSRAAPMAVQPMWAGFEWRWVWKSPMEPAMCGRIWMGPLPKTVGPFFSPPSMHGWFWGLQRACSLCGLPLSSAVDLLCEHPCHWQKLDSLEEADDCQLCSGDLENLSLSLLTNQSTLIWWERTATKRQWKQPWLTWATAWMKRVTRWANQKHSWHKQKWDVTTARKRDKKLMTAQRVGRHQRRFTMITQWGGTSSRDAIDCFMTLGMHLNKWLEVLEMIRMFWRSANCEWECEWRLTFTDFDNQWERFSICITLNMLNWELWPLLTASELQWLGWLTTKFNSNHRDVVQALCRKKHADNDCEASATHWADEGWTMSSPPVPCHITSWNFHWEGISLNRNAMLADQRFMSHGNPVFLSCTIPFFTVWSPAWCRSHHSESSTLNKQTISMTKTNVVLCVWHWSSCDQC